MATKLNAGSKLKAKSKIAELNRRIAILDSKIDSIARNTSGSKTAGAELYAAWFHGKKHPLLPKFRSRVRKLAEERFGLRCDLHALSYALELAPCILPTRTLAALRREDTIQAKSDVYRHYAALACIQGWRNAASEFRTGARVGVR